MSGHATGLMMLLSTLVAMALVLPAPVTSAVPAASSSPSFAIANNRFVRDGENFTIVAACVHYERILPQLWKDRLTRLRAMGVNAIETYVFWNFHNPEPGVYHFGGAANLTQFLQTAQDVGLLVLLRAGPYGCGEWEFGGFPAHLLATPNMTVRTYNPQYIAAVDAWWGVLLPAVKPMLYSNGGNIIMVQVENEYGSYGNVQSNPEDKQYMQHLVSLARKHLGDDVILYTTDGGSLGYMQRGSLPGDAVYTVGDFGPGSDPSGSFSAQKQMNAPGMSPPMCSEFYTGWLTHWGEKMANTSSSQLASAASHLLSMNASFSMYMGHGGTNFGFWSGANGNGGTSFTPHITSYDYDSPVSEGGGHGFGSDGADKYADVQQALLDYPLQPGVPPTPSEPAAPAVKAYGQVTLDRVAPLLPNVANLATKTFKQEQVPSTQESYGQSYGMTLYVRPLDSSGNVSIDINGVRDRGYIYVDEQYFGYTYRTNPASVSVNSTAGSTLNILVENMGRINYGHGMTDPKGILNGVSVNGNNATGSWTVYTLPLNDSSAVASLSYTKQPSPASQAAFYAGSFNVDQVTDTYLSMAGWSKGVAYVNGFNLGRYWDTMGPQHTLYVPAPLLRQGSNDIIVLELEEARADMSISFVSAPVFVNSPCSPSLEAADGMAVALYHQGVEASNQQWMLNSSDNTIRLASNTMLCLQAGPRKDPSTSNPAPQLAACDGSQATQQWSLDDSTKEIRNKGTADCLDITSHATGDGAPLETYACNGGQNQQFTYDTSSKAIVSLQPSMAYSTSHRQDVLSQRDSGAIMVVTVCDLRHD